MRGDRMVEIGGDMVGRRLIQIVKEDYKYKR